MKKYFFIYKTTNILTGSYYYGKHSTSNLEDGYLGSGKRLRYSIRKYGEEYHERRIVEFCDNEEHLRKREREIVNLNELTKIKCMNLIVGGEGSWFHARKKLAEKMNDPIFKEEFRQSVSSSMKRAYVEGRHSRFYFYNWNGKTHKEETKRKIGEKNSIHQQGKKNSHYGTCWIYNDTENKSIKKELLDSFLINGWTKGRKMGL